MEALARFEILQNDQTYKELTADGAKDAASLAAAKASFTSDYPGLPGLVTKVSTDQQATLARERAALQSGNAFSPTLAANDLLQRKADATITGDRAKIAALDALITGASGSLSSLPRASATQESLKVQQDAAKADYLTLMGQRTAATTSRAEALALGSIVVVDRAVQADATVVGLSGVKLAMVALLFVLCFVGGCTFLSEKLDPHLRRASQIENLYGAGLMTTLRMDR